MSIPERPEQAPITSPRSDRVRRIAALSGRSARRRSGLFRLDGPQAVRSLLSERADLIQELHATEVCLDAHPELRELAAGAGCTIRLGDESILRAMVRGDEGSDDVVSPQGVVAVARMPEATWAGGMSGLSTDGPCTVVLLDRLQDPGNVGTVIRTADAAGADLVICATGTADPFAPKAVRASAGSIVHLPVVTGVELDQVLPSLAARGIATAATSGYAETDLFSAELSARIAWILGNEGRGVSEHLLAAADLRVRIPLAGRAESLNVATAATVCLFESLRRREHS